MSHKKGATAISRNLIGNGSAFITTEIEGRPRAVVLIFGFGGAKPRHVAKYANMYNGKLQCSTVAGTASNFDVFSHNDAALDSFALDAIRQTTKILEKDNQRTPIVIHSLSNGGAFVSARISLLMDSVLNINRSKLCQGTKEDQQHLQLFAERVKLGYQIFDSAPCHINLKSSFNVIKNMFPNAILGVSAATVYAMVYSITFGISFLTRRPTKGQFFWDCLLKDTSCMRQGFIFSSNDEISDADKIQEFINQRDNFGVNVMSKRFETSKHVQHIRLHEKEYTEFVENILTNMENKNKQ